MNRFRLLLLAVCLLPAISLAFDWENYNVEDYEEAGGMSFSVQGNSDGSIYGMSFEDATWLANTPIIGQFFLNAMWHDEIDANFGGIGMIFRIMPHWQIAPYIGGGASYNQLFGDSAETRDNVREDEKVESTWAAHAEGGVRVWLPGKIHFFEFYGRQTWSEVKAVGDYWTAGFGYGQNW
jgi:hypothetical protein